MANQQQVDSVKAEVVDYAREKWPMFFSRFFKVSAVSGLAFRVQATPVRSSPVSEIMAHFFCTACDYDACVFTKLLYLFHMPVLQKKPKENTFE